MYGWNIQTFQGTILLFLHSKISHDDDCSKHYAAHISRSACPSYKRAASLPTRNGSSHTLLTPISIPSPPYPNLEIRFVSIRLPAQCLFLIITRNLAIPTRTETDPCRRSERNEFDEFMNAPIAHIVWLMTECFWNNISNISTMKMHRLWK